MINFDNIKKHSTEFPKAWSFLCSPEEASAITQEHKDQNFLATQNYLLKELEEVNTGNAEMVSHEDLEKSLNKAIEKYENRL